MGGEEGGEGDSWLHPKIMIYRFIDLDNLGIIIRIFFLSNEKRSETTGGKTGHL